DQLAVTLYFHKQGVAIAIEQLGLEQRVVAKPDRDRLALHGLNEHIVVEALHLRLLRTRGRLERGTRAALPRLGASGVVALGSLNVIALFAAARADSTQGLLVARQSGLRGGVVVVQTHWGLRVMQ